MGEDSQALRVDAPMGRLKLALSALLLVTACQTPGGQHLSEKARDRVMGSSVLESGPGSQVLRTGPTPPPVAPSVGGPSVPPVPTALDLDVWPFGWVDDAGEASRVGLGLDSRFWSNRKPFWRQALDPKTSPATAARRLATLFSQSETSEEAFRAAWHSWLVYRAAGLMDEARSWLDKADALRPGPVTALERAWDQEFRVQDPWGARELWTAVRGALGPDDERKARLLRQNLFLGRRSLGDVGVDGYVSTLVLDNDDLWVGTWNGALVRWSLTTGTLDLVLAPGATVAPIKLLSVTGWFIYAFQDQNLLRYSKVTGTWRSFPYPAGWTGLRVQGAVADGQESLWVGYLGQGLWHWDRGEWTLVDDSGGGPFLNALVSDGAGGFWVGTKDRGLWSWKSGVWSAVPSNEAPPTNISVLEASPDATKWAVGTWGEGTWMLENGRLHRVSPGKEFVVSVAWDQGHPVWATLDEGLFSGEDAGKMTLGPLDGLPSGGVSALVTWEGRWIWGTSGQGLGWWSEHENPALFR